MSRTIDFGTSCDSQCLGRNGVMTMAGIVVDRLGGNVYLAPITSKGRIGRAFMEIPAEMAAKVAAAMLGESANGREPY